MSEESVPQNSLPPQATEGTSNKVTADGTVVVVWGATGVGKSTLANRLLGLDYDVDGVF